MGETCARSELKTLFLFEALTDEQLDTLCANGHIATFEPGPVCVEGEPATCFYVMIDGELVMSMKSGGIDIETNRTSMRGVYCGAWSAYIPGEQPVYEASVRVTRRSRFFVLDANAYADFMRTEFPMAVHLLEGHKVGGMRRRLHDALVGRHRGPQTGVGRRHVVVEKRGKQPGTVPQQEVEAGLGGRGVCPVGDLLGGRAEHHVAEHGRADEHALALGRRDRKDDDVDQRARELVEDQQLAPPCDDREAVVAEHPVDLVATETGGVDDPARSHASGRRDDLGIRRARTDVDDTEVPGEAGATREGVRRVGEHCRPRADDRLAGDGQAAGEDLTRRMVELPLRMDVSGVRSLLVSLWEHWCHSA